MTMTELPTALEDIPDPSRKCGDCSACCTVLGVPDLVPPKADYVRCTLLKKKRKKGKGACSVYAERPVTCIEYNCYWRFGMGKWIDRPDKTGVIVDSSPALQQTWGRLAVMVREVFPGAARKPRASKLIEKLVATGEAAIFIVSQDKQGNPTRRFVTRNAQLQAKFDKIMEEHVDAH